MNRVSTLLFDFDGTLQEGDKDELYARLLEISRIMVLGLPDDEITEIGQSTPDYREIRAEMVRRANLRNPTAGFTQGYFQEVNLQVSGSFDNLFCLSEGAVDVLDFFKNRDYGLGLVTTRGGNSLPRLLDMHGITEYFSAVVCRDNYKERKPNPEPLLLAIGLLDVDPSEIAYIGDSQRDDVGAAKNAGVISVLKSREIPDFSGNLPSPDYHITTLYELVDLFGN